MPYAESGGGNGDSEKLDGRAVLEALKQRPPRPLRLVAPDVAPELVAICERAMERDPRERYAGMEEMASDLRAYLEGRVVRAYQSGPLAELEKWVLRNKGTAAATAAAVLAVIAGLGVALGIQSTAKREQGRLNEELKGTNTELEGANARLVSEQDRNRVLLDYRSAQVLVAQADELYPATPERIPDFERWLEPAEELLARDQRHAALLAAGDFERYGLRASDALSFRAELEHLRELLPNVSARLATARSLERLTLIDAAPLWERAVAEVAASPLYAGATLEPELGLVPLGANEQGYQEFWHVLSGTRPEHHPRGPGFDLATESGMVLVFLPGGSFTMGSPEDEPGRNQTEDLVAANVAPFFLSKYETTQAQYERAMGTNPSFYFADREGAESYTPTNPVESITWLDARELARRLALTLPLESEWESGCRGGTRTRYHTGDHPRTLVGFENLNDEAETMRFYSAPEDWHDGFSRHAPVGSFPPNPFGLHDVHGNVQEWCANIEESDASGRARVIRGGSWYSKAHEARSTVSWLQYERVPNVTVGVRLALAPNRD
jgi:formylglycine-generating enzyme required for sulfatase activity